MFIDTQLLVLLVVGETDRALISKHRRTRAYRVEDYELLVRLINETDRQVFVTPNTLTEASNLLAQHGEPERSRMFGVLQVLIETTEEKVVESKVAGRNSNFRRLGLTDAALLEIVSASNPLITTDLDLYLAASAKEAGAAYNFTHYRDFPPF
jgi:tRNA A37 threonylcarbamoyladenosine synthetase subunit TsaC/SUA5/YrdC